MDRPELYYKVDGHWNCAGHRHAAAVLAPYLAQQFDRPDFRP
jgi:hypothetical protein